MRRSVTITHHCAFPGCDQTARFHYSSNAEYIASHEFKRYEKRREPYFCAKHSSRIVLSPTVLKSEWLSEPSRPLDGHPEDSYRSFGSQGIMFGPGFAAEGRDFPIGTRIKVTAEVILPEPPCPTT